MIALQVLFEVDATGHDADAVLERQLAEQPVVPEAAEYAGQLVHGVLKNLDRIDGLIANAAPHWPVAQLPKIDKNILRLAIYEVLVDNRVPTKAAINEAVELAKIFGSESSSRFVNGVLGTVVSQVGIE
ncbi:MAG: transcription antitermination factor NusB [Chloroflexi bacterium]|nr:transcription antitermination factor NusB [Chloroflexota bacterium]